jgi:uncharacterized RDD family membrane protein YckC
MHITECPECNTSITEDENYCHKCGKDLKTTTSRSRVNNYRNNQVYQKASAGSRLLAYLIDSIIILILSLPSIVLIIMGIIAIFSNNFNIYALEELRLQDVNISAFILGSVLIIIPLIYRFIKDGLGKGQSVGKRAMGIMVVNIDDNKPCSIGSSILRELIWTLISLFPIFGWLVEPIMALVNDDGRRLGDLAAGTMVIEKCDYKETEI